MKAYKLFIALSLIGVLGITSCRDEFAELNQDPKAVTTPDPASLATSCMLKFDTNDYTYWFYNQKLYNTWSQMGTSGSFSEATYGQGPVNYQTNYITCLTYRNDIDNYITAYGANEMKAYSAMCGVLAVYGAIYASDINGDIQYIDGAKYRVGGSLTPAYESVETLYDKLIEDLDAYIAIFKDETQVVTAKQDIIYGGNLTKWIKLCNSLKLKVAVRLYLNNASKAGQIASSVANSADGYIDSLEDAFIFHKADDSTGGDLAYQTGNSLNGWMANSSKNVIDYMKASRDPRVRFFYTKNSYNSQVIQCFIDQGKYDDLPQVVKNNINLDATGNFESFILGEPWCRYEGTPVVFYQSDEYKGYIGEYFETAERYNVKIGDATKSYGVTSDTNEEMVRGRCGYTVPTIPGGPVIQDNDQHAWWGLYLGAGEVNLYFAELANLGVSLPKGAQAYYERGVELSVTEWDYVAGKNMIPYYGKTYDYDPLEASIELKDGEIAAMLATDAVKWDGSMEKIYLQELMNFTMMPNESFVTARRSGYPKIGSRLLPFVKFNEVELTAIPRRFETPEPSPTDIMYDIRMANLKAQGFTPGTSQSGSGYATTTVLNTERLWQDKNAPQWGSATK